MKHFACIIMLLLACLPPIVAQELSDSAFWDAEMEDSISGMAIMPVKKPKELLDSIIAQLIRDWERKPTVAHWYRVENRTFPFPKHPTYPVVSSYIFPAGSGIILKTIGKPEDFRFEGPVNLTPQDTAGVMFALDILSTSSPILDHVYSRSVSDNKTKGDIFQKLMSLYDVKVYSITDNSGRGVYRVNYTPNKKITATTWMYYEVMVTGTAYFDLKTLRILQAKGDKSYCRYYPKREVTQGGSYQIDYEMEGDRPVFKRKWNGSKDEKPPGAGITVHKLE
ncbi:MAG: hypothetical protein J6Y40_01185 [Bacteroidales bacterium]|nr:hypothetical protein [Bacteroidales bacterium]